MSLSNDKVVEMNKLIPAVTACALLAFSLACNYHAAPEANTSKSSEQARRVKTPSGGGPETTDKHSVRERPPTPDNIQQGSAVAPAPADQTRPHPQPQQNQPAQTAQQKSSSGPQ
ncbi:MAG TPA: hypothetical protein VG498_20695 [Terriglobales bacterium]|nr:hypothetical protein [Terriglobales bacterium]